MNWSNNRSRFLIHVLVRRIMWISISYHCVLPPGLAPRCSTAGPGSTAVKSSVSVTIHLSASLLFSLRWSHDPFALLNVSLMWEDKEKLKNTPKNRSLGVFVAYGESVTYEKCRKKLHFVYLIICHFLSCSLHISSLILRVYVCHFIFIF